MRRGEVYFVDFGKDKTTHKQCGIRPAVIVSNNRGNGHGPKQIREMREQGIEYTDGAEPLTKMDTDFMLKTLDHIKVFEDGTLLVVFLDGTEIECKNEEE